MPNSIVDVPVLFLSLIKLMGVIMFKKLMYCGQLVILVGIIVGCETILINQGIPTHPQEEQVMVGSFKFKLEKVYWDATSLCLIVSATNTGKRPLALTKSFAFNIVNEENDVRYSTEFVSGDAMFGAGGMTISPAYNPNVTKKDTLCVKDIPKDKYILLVRIGDPLIGGDGVTIVGHDWRDFFRWALNL